MKNLEH